jgi:hypothetical protein
MQRWFAVRRQLALLQDAITNLILEALAVCLQAKIALKSFATRAGRASNLSLPFEARRGAGCPDGRPQSVQGVNPRHNSPARERGIAGLSGFLTVETPPERMPVMSEGNRAAGNAWCGIRHR